MALIVARYASACKVCHRAIVPGDRIDWTKGQREVAHAACSDAGKAVQEQTQASRAVDGPVDVACPEGLTYLGYQRAGIGFARGRDSVLIADEMGLGKTIQAIGIINDSPEVKRVLVVCPASLKLNWRSELQRWLVRPMTIGVVNGKVPLDADVLVVNYDVLRKLPPDYAADLIVVDEAHYAKNPKAQRTKLLASIARRCGRRVYLTGTPILNRPIELWPLLQQLAPETWDPPGFSRGKQLGAGEGAGFFRFVKRYCDARKVFHGRGEHWDFSGASNLVELQEKLRSSLMVRRLKKDVLSELPPKRRQVVAVNSQKDDGLAPGDDYETVSEKAKSIPFDQLSAARHSQALSKVPAALEHLRDALESSAKIVVFAHHHDVIDALATGLSEFGCVTLTGETPNEERQAAVERFQSDTSCRVFIGSIKAAGVGLTLTAAAHVVFVELSWVPADLSQAEDRCHRIGQTESVLVQHLVTEGTLDARMTQFVVQKQEIADAALDNETIQDVSTRPIVETREEKQARLAREAGITVEEISHIHAQLRFLAARCDGAVAEDGVGYNGLDTNFGKSLARQALLSPKQAIMAKQMLVKYRGQLSQMG